MTKQTFRSFEDLKSLLPEDKVIAFERHKEKLKKTKQTAANPPKNEVKKNKFIKKTRKNPKPNKPIDPKLQAIFDALNWLKETFPNTFVSPPKQVFALKIGIGQEISNYLKEKNVEISITLIRKALAMYTRNFRYLTASSKVGNPRLDLEGEKVDVITEEQAKYAQEKLTKLKEKQKQKQSGFNSETTLADVENKSESN